MREKSIRSNDRYGRHQYLEISFFSRREYCNFLLYKFFSISPCFLIVQGSRLSVELIFMKNVVNVPKERTSCRTYMI